MEPSFWQGKKVFVTGHTGFKGSWLSLWLKKLGAEVVGYALAPLTSPALFQVSAVAQGMTSVTGDIRDRTNLCQVMSSAAPEIVIHMAAQALVRYSYDHPAETYEVNVMGTVNLLEAVRACESVRTVLVVTSDKCYENREWTRGYREEDAMGGYDPYSNSKGCAELVVSAYRSSFFKQGSPVAVATARAGNVIGGGDWSADRLIPDMVRSFSNNEPVVIRNPQAVRPWQHVFEALSGYLLLLEKMWEEPEPFSEGWNFGPDDSDSKTVSWVVDAFARRWGDAQWSAEDNPEHPHEAHHLHLDCAKAKSKLHWQRVVDLETALEWIVKWYRCYYAGEDMRSLSERQLAEFQKMVGS